jgi:hypothetical protein
MTWLAGIEKSVTLTFRHHGLRGFPRLPHSCATRLWMGIFIRAAKSPNIPAKEQEAVQS